MKDFYLDPYRIAKIANITPITTITNEPTVPPTVTAKVLDVGELIVSADCRETNLTNKNKTNKNLQQF